MTAACIFCRIARDEARAYKVGQNAQAVAFFDAYPLAGGHTLVVPKRHVERLADLTEEEVGAVFGLMHAIVRGVGRALHAPATTVGVNDGAASGQTMSHVHVHVLPRFAGDGVGSIHSLAWPRPRPSSGELEELARRIAEASQTEDGTVGRR